MENLKAIIVEDSETNIRILGRLLEEHCSYITVIGIGRTINESLNLIKDLDPDLVFMDIQLPKGTSFDLLKQLKQNNNIDFDVIFVTAHHEFEYAIKAITYSALDYITKPINADLLKEAVDKAWSKKLNSPVDSKLVSEKKEEQLNFLFEQLRQPKQSSSTRFAIHMVRGVVEFIDVSDIIYCEADSTVTHFYLINGKRKTAVKNLGFYKEMLVSDHDFFQVSSSLIVHLLYVKSYNQSERSILFENDIVLYASKRMSVNFKNYLANKQVAPPKNNNTIIRRFINKLLD